MMNQIVLVGRISTEFKKCKTSSGNEGTIITLAIPRSYKNEYGEYDTDFIPVLLVGSVSENTLKYCKKGDLVGVKGSLVLDIFQGKKALYVRGERVTFLSSTKMESEDE